jgi:SNF2 family DNA or RNA helicase
MLSTWQEELYTHGRIPAESVTILDATSKAKKTALINKAIASTPPATVVTYTTAALYQEQILQIGYRLIVADESHQMASPFSNRTKAATALASRAYRRVLLSGTPSLGSPFDLYAQLRFLGTYFCPEDWWAFRKKFGVYPEWEANENVPKMLLGFKNLDIINERVNRICVRRTKEECLDLPERVIIDKKFALSHSLKKVYNDFIMDRADAAGFVLQKDMDAGLINNSTGPVVPPHVLAPETITVLGKLTQISSGFMYKTTKNPKLCDGCTHLDACLAAEIQPYTPRCQVISEDPAPHVEHYKDNARLEQLEGLLDKLLLDENNKVIIWANYITQLDDICELAAQLKYAHVRVQGGMSTDDLKAARTSFNEDPKVRLYVGQASTGIGITLNAANYTIYYDLPWSLEHYLQSIDRNYRIGQASKVTVYRLIGAHTLDEAKAAALDQKMDFSHLVTTRSICATCPEFARRCAAHKISLYDPDCIHDRVTMRKTAEIKLIP